MAILPADNSRPFFSENIASCRCCPRACGIDRRTQTGYCGAGALPRVARAAKHFGEEPVISGVRGSGTVFFSGCNLGCLFCQNKEISAVQMGTPMGTPMDAPALARVFLSLQAQEAHNINLVTPTPHIHVIAQALCEAKAGGLTIPVVYNSGGYESVSALKALAGLVDIYLPDLKYVDTALSAAYSGAPDYFAHAAAALYEMHAQAGALTLGADGMAVRGLIIRHLVLPGCLMDMRRVLDFIRQAFSADTCISLMRQYTPAQGLPAPLNRALTAREYARAVDYCASLGFENVYIQGKDAVGARHVPTFYDEILTECDRA